MEMAAAMTVRTCARCGVALTPSHGGDPRRIMAVYDNGYTETADLCATHYRDAVAAIEAALCPPARKSHELGANREKRAEIVRDALSEEANEVV